jgi:hypothetical protein
MTGALAAWGGFRQCLAARIFPDANLDSLATAEASATRSHEMAKPANPQACVRQVRARFIPTDFLSWIKKFCASSEKYLRANQVLESPRVAALHPKEGATNGIRRATKRVLN